MRKELNDFEIEEVKKQAREKLGICRKSNDIIGTQVFSILGLYARVIYYPLGKNAPWGFTRISGSKNDAGLDKPFVAINTSIPVQCRALPPSAPLHFKQGCVNNLLGLSFLQLLGNVLPLCL